MQVLGSPRDLATKRAHVLFELSKHKIRSVARKVSRTVRCRVRKAPSRLSGTRIAHPGSAFVQITMQDFARLHDQNPSLFWILAVRLVGALDDRLGDAVLEAKMLFEVV